MVQPQLFHRVFYISYPRLLFENPYLKGFLKRFSPSVLVPCPTLPGVMALTSFKDTGIWKRDKKDHRGLIASSNLCVFMMACFILILGTCNTAHNGDKWLLVKRWSDASSWHLCGHFRFKWCQHRNTLSSDTKYWKQAWFWRMSAVFHLLTCSHFTPVLASVYCWDLWTRLGDGHFLWQKGCQHGNTFNLDII